MLNLRKVAGNGISILLIGVIFWLMIAFLPVSTPPSFKAFGADLFRSSTALNIVQYVIPFSAVAAILLTASRKSRTKTAKYGFVGAFVAVVANLLLWIVALLVIILPSGWFDIGTREAVYADATTILFPFTALPVLLGVPLWAAIGFLLGNIHRERVSILSNRR